MWVNSLIASAGGQIVDEDGNVKVDATAKQAAEIMKQLATSRRRRPGLTTNNEDEARLGFESGRSAFQINYPFIYPSAAEVKDPRTSRRRSAGRATRRSRRASRAGRRWAASTSA